MRIVFYMGHPAHFHLLRNPIKILEGKGHTIAVLSKKKDILDRLLIDANIKYTNILPEGRSNSKYGLLVGMLKRDIRLFKFARKFKPDIMVGTSVEISHVGKSLGIPSVNLNEDDADVVPFYSKFSYPLASVILSPYSCNNGKWENKSIKYPSFHELAYLHPDVFTPDINVVKKYFNPQKPYFLIRFAKLDAHHDKGISGISNENALSIINLLETRGRVIINSEKVLGSDLEKYRLNIDVLDMHHILSFATMYIGDSQTMAAEAGILGIPFIRINDFVGRISYLKELEDEYKVGYGVRPENFNDALVIIKNILNDESLSKKIRESRNQLLKDKINLSDFLVWFIENYPTSKNDIEMDQEFFVNTWSHIDHK